MENLAYLAVGGFLVGATLYSGYYTSRYEPDVRHGYELVGAGVLLLVVVNTYLDFTRPIAVWYRVTIFVGYLFIAAGLTAIVRTRRRRHHNPRRNG